MVALNFITIISPLENVRFIRIKHHQVPILPTPFVCDYFSSDLSINGAPELQPTNHHIFIVNGSGACHYSGSGFAVEGGSIIKILPRVVPILLNNDNAHNSVPPSIVSQPFVQLLDETSEDDACKSLIHQNTSYDDQSSDTEEDLAPPIEQFKQSVSIIDPPVQSACKCDYAALERRISAIETFLANTDKSVTEYTNAATGHTICLMVSRNHRSTNNLNH